MIIFILLLYLPKKNPPPNRNWPIYFSINPFFWHTLHYFRYIGLGIFNFNICSFMLVISWYVFIVHIFVLFSSTIISCVLFVLSCTILQFGFVSSVLLLFFWTDTNTPRPPQHWWKLWHPPLPSNRRTSRPNGGAPDTVPTTVGTSTPPSSFGLSNPSPQANLFHSTSQRPQSHFHEQTNTMMIDDTVAPPHLKNQWCRSQSSVPITGIPFYRLCPTQYFLWMEPHKPLIIPSRSSKVNLSEITIFPAKSIPF